MFKNNYRPYLIIPTFLGCVVNLTGAEKPYTTSTVIKKAGIEIDLTLGAPKPYYEYQNETLSWKTPEKESHYMLVRVKDLATGSILPGCNVTAAVTDENGKDVETSITLVATWGDKDYHYGNNIKLPDSINTGTIKLTVVPPSMRRLDEKTGDFFTAPELVNFSNAIFSSTTLGLNTTPTIEKMEKIDWPDGRRPYVTPTPYPGSK